VVDCEDPRGRTQATCGWILSKGLGRRATVVLQPGCWTSHLGRDHHGDVDHGRCGCQTEAPQQPVGGRGAAGRVGASGLVDAEATRAEGGAVGGAMLSSARRRSARTLAKEGKGRC